MQQYNPILERLQTLAKANGDIEVLWLYGSRARGTHSEEQRIWSEWEAYEYAHEREYNRSGVSGNTSDYASDKN